MTRPARPLLVAILLLAGCAAEADPNTLLARVQRDCAEGLEDACSLFQGMRGLGTNLGSRSRGGRHAYGPQVQQDVGALLQGMDRARASPRLHANEPPQNGKS
ncbi:MAG: hypothetical protein NVSMB18_00620 [Acetobacteraceae bacterium]